MLEERKTEKTTLNIKVHQLPYVPEHQYFVMIQDLEKQVWFITFVSLLVFIVSIIL